MKNNNVVIRVLTACFIAFNLLTYFIYSDIIYNESLKMEDLKNSLDKSTQSVVQLESKLSEYEILNELLIKENNVLKNSIIEPTKIEQTTTFSREILDVYEVDALELDWLSKLIYAEAGGTSETCMRYVGEVVANRVGSPLYNGDSIIEIIMQKGQFSVVKNGRINVKPSITSIRIAKEVLSGVRTIPKDVLAFRSGHYHTGSRYTNWCSIDNMYFSFVR